MTGPITAASGLLPRTIAVLAGPSTRPAAEGIVQALEHRGVRALLADLADVRMVDGAVLHHGSPIGAVDAAVGYHGALIPTGGMQRMRQMAAAGIPFLNDADSIAGSRDKWLTAVALQRAGIPHPQTVLARSTEDVRRGAAELGLPVVLKLRRGTEGKGVAKVSDASELPAIADMVLATGQPVVMQQLIRLPRGRIAGTRAFVIGGKVVASMERRPGAGTADFRANISNGGSARAVTLHPADEHTAVAAARALNLDIAGVDLMGARGSMQVIEANSGAGHKISDITGVDVAGLIADHAIETARRGARLTAG